MALQVMDLKNPVAVMCRYLYPSPPPLTFILSFTLTCTTHKTHTLTIDTHTQTTHMQDTRVLILSFTLTCTTHKTHTHNTHTRTDDTHAHTTRHTKGGVRTEEEGGTREKLEDRREEVGVTR